MLDVASQAAGFTVSADGHTAVGPAPVLTLLTLDLGDGNDKVAISAVASCGCLQYDKVPNATYTTPINIQGGDGEDRFNIGTESLLLFDNEITVDAGPDTRDFLNISDTRTALARTYRVTDNSISVSNGPLISFSGIFDLSLEGGIGANTYRIESLSGGQSLEVEGSDGFDTFLIGSTDNSLASIGGELNIITNGGNDRLVFNDQGRAGNNTATLTSTAFDADSGPPISYEALAGDTVVLNLRPSPTASLFVPSLASSVEYVLNAGPDGTPIILGSGGPDSLGALLGHTTIVGNGGSTLTIDESAGSTAHDYLIDAFSLRRDGVELVQFSGLLRGTLSTGSGADLIDAGASSTRFDLDAGAGDDRIIALALGAFINAGPGNDTLTATRISGDVTLDASGLSGPAFGAGLTFPAGAPEIVKLGGDKAPNVINADAFPGLAVLDGGGGGDTLIGGDVNLVGKTATFTDPDGDLVTIQNDVARFSVTNVDFLPAGSGAALSRLDLSAGPKRFAQANLTITATRGALGGDGHTAVGQLIANDVDLASIIIDGDLRALEVGDADAATRALGLLKVNSIGLFGTTYLPVGAPADFFFTGKAVRIEVATDFASGGVNVSGGASGSGKLGSLVVGGEFAGNVYTTGRIGSIDLGSMIEGSSIIADAGARIAALIIRHGMRSADIYADGALGSIEISGNVVDSRIIAHGNDSPATADSAIALGSLRVGGSITDSFIGAGFERTALPVNPDVTIGSVFIAGNFNQSDLVAGINPGDGVFGNGNEVAAIPGSGAFAGIAGGDPAITARIAKVVIGGGVFGTPTAPIVHHAIIAQQIDRLKVGGEPLPLTDGPDNLLLALSGAVRAVEIG